MAKAPTLTQIRRTLRSYADAHKKLRALYGRKLSNASLLQLAQACLTKPTKKRPAAKKKTAKLVLTPVLVAEVPVPVVGVPAPIPDVEPLQRPKLFQAIQIIMGKGAMTAREVTEALKARNWEPLSTDPGRFVGQYLHQQRIYFQRVPAKGAAVSYLLATRVGV